MDEQTQKKPVQRTKNKAKERVLIITEGAIMVALAVVLDLIPLPKIWAQGGSISLAMIPIIYYSYRHGALWGLLAGLVDSGLQIIMGWNAPPAGTFLALAGCVLLDYVAAFAVIGLADLFAKPFQKKNRLFAYGFGAATVCMLRFLCSFLSGAMLWGSYAWDGWGVWTYSFVYNCTYMLPNAIISAVAIVLIAMVLDPLTLRRMKLKKKRK